MAELADAADSKSAGTWYLGGSTPPPGTSLISRCHNNLVRQRGERLHMRPLGNVTIFVTNRDYSSF